MKLNYSQPLSHSQPNLLYVVVMGIKWKKENQVHCSEFPKGMKDKNVLKR